MNVFKVPCLLFYVDLIVGEQEWQQGDHLGGYCGHLCVKWGVAEELERSEFSSLQHGDGGFRPTNGLDVVW